MREHESVTTPIDPVFAEATSLLFAGAVDTRELWDVVSKLDQADAHVRRPMSPGKAKREKAERRIAIATNAAGVIGGPAAIYAAAKSPALRPKAGKEFRAHPRNAGPIGRGLQAGASAAGFKRVARVLKHPATLATGAGLATGLQVANMAGDAIAIKYISRADKKKHVAKAFADIVAARRAGTISTEQALQAVAQVEKKITVRPIFRPLPSRAGARLRLKGMTRKGKAANARQEESIRQAVANNRSKAIKATFIGTTATAAGAGGTYGYHKGKERGQEMPRLPIPSQQLKAAPKKEVRKSQEFTTTWTGEISKVDEDKRQVFGWCSLSELDGKPVVDLQGDYVPISEIEKSAYAYVLTSRKGGDMHSRDGESPLHTADMIESFVVTPEKLEQMGLPKDSLPLGWWVGFKVNDDKQWELVKKRERTGFSIHGKGSRTSKMLED